MSTCPECGHLLRDHYDEELSTYYAYVCGLCSCEIKDCVLAWRLCKETAKEAANAR